MDPTEPKSLLWLTKIINKGRSKLGIPNALGVLGGVIVILGQDLTNGFPDIGRSLTK